MRRREECPLEMERLAPDFKICGWTMDSPKLCERVRLLGNPHPFFVISVDEERKLVDLMPVSGRGPCLDAVPFDAVQHGDAKATEITGELPA